MKEIELAGLPNDVKEVGIQVWLFEEGDAVQAGEEILEVIADDTSYVFNSPLTGILSEIYYDEGEVVQVGDVICGIEDDEPLA